MQAPLSKTRIWINYILTYLVIAFSGVEVFDMNRIARFGFLIVMGIAFIYYAKKLDKSILVIIIVTLLILLAQSYIWGGKLFTTITFIGLLVLLPYFAIKVIGLQFLRYYRDILFYLALISLVFWAATNAVPGFHSLTKTMAETIGKAVNPEVGMFNESLLIYNYERFAEYGFIRNPGCFHEPGAYSVFLILAIISETFISKKLMTRKNIVFFIALATTFSTAGYLSGFVIIGFYVYTSKKLTMPTKYTILVGILGLLVYLFTTLEFLSDKITNQLEAQTEARLHEETAGRFLGARKALIVLYRHPLWGRGLLTMTKPDPDSEEAAGYGWIRWVSRIGIIAGLIYLFYLFKGIRNYSVANLNSKAFAVIAYIALLGVLAGQKHTNALVFFMIFLIPLLYPFELYWQDYILEDTKPEKPDNKKPPRVMTLSERASMERAIRRKEGLIP